MFFISKRIAYVLSADAKYLLREISVIDLMSSLAAIDGKGQKKQLELQRRIAAAKELLAESGEARDAISCAFAYRAVADLCRELLAANDPDVTVSDYCDACRSAISFGIKAAETDRNTRFLDMTVQIMEGFAKSLGGHGGVRFGGGDADLKNDCIDFTARCAKTLFKLMNDAYPDGCDDECFDAARKLFGLRLGLAKLTKDEAGRLCCVTEHAAFMRGLACGKMPSLLTLTPYLETAIVFLDEYEAVEDRDAARAGIKALLPTLRDAFCAFRTSYYVISQSLVTELAKRLRRLRGMTGEYFEPALFGLVSGVCDYFLVKVSRRNLSHNRAASLCCGLGWPVIEARADAAELDRSDALIFVKACTGCLILRTTDEDGAEFAHAVAGVVAKLAKKYRSKAMHEEVMLFKDEMSGLPPL